MKSIAIGICTYHHPDAVYDILGRSVQDLFDRHIDVYYYDLEAEKCFIDEDNYSLMLEEKETNLLVPYSILHVITRNIN